MSVLNFRLMISHTHSATSCHRLLPLCAALSLMPGLLLAQEAKPDAADQASAEAPAVNKLDVVEVIVTAERRGSVVQKTPISMTAVSGLKLKEQGISSVADLMRDIPGVSAKAGGSGQTEYTIRGLSSAAGVAPTVGFYLDDVPLSSPTTSSGGKSPVDPDLYDLARVEVLRGPQGTLYGASSMGGTIKLVPEAPRLNRFGGSAQAIASQTQGGGRNGTVNAALNIPLLEDVAAMRVVITKKHESGWIDRVTSSAMPLANPDESRGDVAATVPDAIRRRANDTRLDGARVSLSILPTDRLSITPSFLYQRTRQGGPDTFDSDPGQYKHYQPFSIAEPFKDEFSIGSVKADYDLDAVTITSVTSYSKRRKTRVEDETEILQRYFSLPSYSIAGGGLGPITNTEFNSTRQFTQEFRLTSNSPGPLRWILGTFYSRFTSVFEAISDGSPEAAAAVLGTSDIFHQTISDTLVQKAVFGNLSYDITKSLKITGGMRFFRSNAQNVSTASGILSDGTNHDEKASSKGTTPMLNLAYEVNPTSMLYATAAKGYREGAAQPGVAASCAGDLAALGLTEAPVRYKPDAVWSYEVGSKNRFMDNALTLNGSLYTQKWSDVQRYVTLPTCGFLYVDNAGQAQANGFEVEAALRVAGGLSLSFSVGHTRAVYSRDDPGSDTKRGQRLDGVAAWTGSGSLHYETPVADYVFIGNLGVSYTGRSSLNVSERKVLDPYTLVDARIGLKANKWNVNLFVNNVTNHRAVTTVVPSLTFNPIGIDRLAGVRPRTIGFDVSRDF
jgi:outer membrane receptor protein involved in Fe transport